MGAKTKQTTVLIESKPKRRNIQTTYYDIENMTNESKSNKTVVTEDGTVCCPADPLLHPYGTPRDAWLSCAVLIVVETPLWFVTMRVTTFGEKVTIGTAVGSGVGIVPIMGE